jgi:hypothetical protein
MFSKQLMHFYVILLKPRIAYGKKKKNAKDVRDEI